MATPLWNALVRTHHITSRKKVAILKAAAKRLDCYALLRSGGIPGVMFVQGQSRDDVQQWVDVVHGLRYKDYQLVSAVAEAPLKSVAGTSKLGSLEEVPTVKEMGAVMDKKGLLKWWRLSMGFAGS